MKRGVGAWCLRLAVLTYQATLRPLLGGQCRFHPTCSEYALEAIDCHGAWRGGMVDHSAIVSLPSGRRTWLRPGSGA